MYIYDRRGQDLPHTPTPTPFSPGPPSLAETKLGLLGLAWPLVPPNPHPHPLRPRPPQSPGGTTPAMLRIAAIGLPWQTLGAEISELMGTRLIVQPTMMPA